jgi:hypothetical protein
LGLVASAGTLDGRDPFGAVDAVAA